MTNSQWVTLNESEKDKMFWMYYCYNRIALACIVVRRGLTQLMSFIVYPHELTCIPPFLKGGSQFYTLYTELTF